MTYEVTQADELVEAVEQLILRHIEEGRLHSAWTVGSIGWRNALACAAIAAIHQSTEAARIEGAKAMQERCAKAVHEAVFPMTPEDEWSEYAANKARIARMAVEAIRSLDSRNIDQVAG